MRKRILPAGLAWLGLSLTPVACVSQTVERASAPVVGVAQPGIAASLAIEQFLRAANATDLDAMARLFGTRDGSILQRDAKRNVEDRMFALSHILRHENYEIERTQIVPGRREEATQITVRMTIDRREVSVPWTMVLGRDGQWRVEQIDIEKITAHR
jgi:hypothetical protein